MFKKIIFPLISLSLLTAKAQEYQYNPYHYSFLECLQKSKTNIQINNVNTLDIITVNYFNNKTDTTDSYYKINFDKNGNITMWLHYFKKNLKQFGHFQYNSKNQIIYSIHYFDVNKWFFATYEYNDFDSLQKITLYDETKEICNILELTYNNNKKLISKQWTKPLFQMPLQERFEYNRSQQISKITTAENDGTIIEKHFTWQNNNMLTEKHYTDGKCFLSVVYSYNDKNLLTSKNAEHLDTQIKVTYNYEYENKLIIKECESHYDSCKEWNYFFINLPIGYTQYNQAKKPMFKRIYKYNNKFNYFALPR